MTVPVWKTRAEFEAWWKANVREFNRMAMTDPAGWEAVARKVEAFQVRNRGY